MAQDTLLTDELESGRKLVERLISNGFDVSLAFWVKESDAGQWFLYLASSVVDAKGSTEAYRVVLPIVEDMPESGISPFAVKVVGINDSMVAAAREVIKPRLPDSQFAVRNPRPYPSMTRFGGSTLGGINIEGAYIYPPSRPEVSV